MDDIRSGDIERELSMMAGALTLPFPVECVACFVWRMLDEFGCNATARWVRHWRDARAPRATALEQRLARMGGCCDCELFLNVWTHDPGTARAGAGREDAVLLPSGHLCAGVRRGSSQPCRLWVRRSRWWPR